MGYFFSMTWMWWLLAIVLAVVITWAIFRERKHKDQPEAHDKRAGGRRGHLANDGVAGGGEFQDERAQMGGEFQGGRGRFETDEERARLAADAERTRVDNPGVNIPGQHASLKERAEELKEKAEARTGRRKFF